MESSAEILATHCIPAPYSIGDLPPSGSQQIGDLPPEPKPKKNERRAPKKLQPPPNAKPEMVDDQLPRENGIARRNRRRTNRRGGRRNAMPPRGGQPPVNSGPELVVPPAESPANGEAALNSDHVVPTVSAAADSARHVSSHPEQQPAPHTEQITDASQRLANAAPQATPNGTVE